MTFTFKRSKITYPLWSKLHKKYELHIVVVAAPHTVKPYNNVTTSLIWPVNFRIDISRPKKIHTSDNDKQKLHTNVCLSAFKEWMPRCSSIRKVEADIVVDSDFAQVIYFFNIYVIDGHKVLHKLGSK
ncbi:hypothetical protein EGR_10451 [Echinococcus granulosus]|uniref:Uncharacterized protein n=1 Tax=Echinococcus granulosus TaxID=6210 RepID=W6UMH2_ECHGR|nr:hypothetical protein EGR_10451 [Echinococcus granulosus]EUB54689.1 hypothetical protein EGR_10451 [Echinococcus granulosus]